MRPRFPGPTPEDDRQEMSEMADLAEGERRTSSSLFAFRKSIFRAPPFVRYHIRKSEGGSEKRKEEKNKIDANTNTHS